MSTNSQAVLWAMVAAAIQAATPPTPATPLAPVTQPAAAPSAEVPPPPAGFVRIPANTFVSFEIVNLLNSKTSTINQMFPIRLTNPIRIGGVIVLPAGTMGQGQVVHVAKASGPDKAGELILAARYLSCGDTQIALRGLDLGQSGANRASELTQAIAAIGALVAPQEFVSGGESIILGGTRANSRLQDAVDVRVEAGAPCAARPVAPAVPVAQ